MRIVHSLAALAVVASCSSTAPSSSTTPNKISNTLAETVSPKDKLFCGDYAYMSAMIMESRQIGVPMSRALGVFAAQSGFDELMHMVVVEAYKTPASSTPKDQKKAIVEFSNRQHALCLQT